MIKARVEATPSIRRERSDHMSGPKIIPPFSRLIRPENYTGPIFRPVKFRAYTAIFAEVVMRL